MIRMSRQGHRVFAHGATWDWNPKEYQERYVSQYQEDPVKARRDYEAFPPQDIASALVDISAVERLHDPTIRDPVLPDGSLAEWFRPDPMAEYYLHGDLSRSRDATGLALTHFDVEAGVVVVDMMMRLVPTERQPISFERVVLIVMTLRARGFRIIKVTFDGWQSYHLIERLTATGIESDVYSVDRTTEAYDTLFHMLLTKRLRFGRNEVLFRELRDLKLIGGKKYDHPPAGSKDLADAVAAATSQCVKARVGVLNKIDLEAVTHDDHLLNLEVGQTESGSTVYHVITTLVLPVEKARVRSVRIDMADEAVLLLWGWYGRQDDRHYLEEFLVWDRFDTSALESFDVMVQSLLKFFTVGSFSLGPAVPVELISIVQSTGKPIATPFSSRVPGQHGRVAQVGQVDAAMMRRCLDHVRRGQVSLPRVLPLFQDVRYVTDDTLEGRPYLNAFVAWWDYAAREAQFGRSGKQLPAPQISRGAVSLNQSVRRAASVPVAGHDEVAAVRKMAYAGGQPDVATPAPVPGGRRTLPRARKL